MAQALSAEEFERMQVGAGGLAGRSGAAFGTAVTPPFHRYILKAQLLELRTENYRLSDQLRRSSTGKGAAGGAAPVGP